MKLEIASYNQIANWNDYVINHPDSTVFHLFEWKNIIENSYNHKAYFNIAKKKVK